MRNQLLQKAITSHMEWPAKINLWYPNDSLLSFSFNYRICSIWNLLMYILIIIPWAPLEIYKNLIYLQIESFPNSSLDIVCMYFYFRLIHNFSFILMIQKGETSVDFVWPTRYIYIYIHTPYLLTWLYYHWKLEFIMDIKNSLTLSRNCLYFIY